MLRTSITRGINFLAASRSSILSNQCAVRSMSIISRPSNINQLSYNTGLNSSIFNQMSINSNNSKSDILSQVMNSDKTINNNVKYEITDFNQQGQLEVDSEDKTMYMDSVLRKRRLKMKKHKLRKRRREQRSLKKRLGKL